MSCNKRHNRNNMHGATIKIGHWFVIVQNNKMCTVQMLK